MTTYGIVIIAIMIGIAFIAYIADAIEIDDDDTEVCVSCENHFDVSTMTPDDEMNWFCPECWEELAPIMKQEHDEIVANGEIDKDDLHYTGQINNNASDETKQAVDDMAKKANRQINKAPDFIDIIHFNGTGYPLRQITHAGIEGLLIAPESLDIALMFDDGHPINEEAAEIDNMIYFYVPDDKINLPEPELTALVTELLCE